MTATVTISLDTARHAVACIHAQATGGLELIGRTPENLSADDQALVLEAAKALSALRTAEVELLKALDQARGALTTPLTNLPQPSINKEKTR